MHRHISFIDQESILDILREILHTKLFSSHNTLSWLFWKLFWVTEKISISTTDHENNFSWLKEVCFDLESCSISGDFDSNFQLAQNISVFMFQSFYYYLGLFLVHPVRKTSQHKNWKYFSVLTNWKVTARDEIPSGPENFKKSRQKNREIK